MKIALASDHGGLALKNEIVKYLKENGHDFALRAAEAVARGECEKGVFVCTTGIGISIAANKVPGIRCALCTDPYLAKMTREHNDANVLALGGGFIGVNLALETVRTFLTTPFSEEAKHQRRIDKISEIEKKYNKVRLF